MSKLEPDLIDFQEPEPGYVLAPDGSQKAAWATGYETGLAHLVVAPLISRDCEASVCGLPVMRPCWEDFELEKLPHCSACREMFSGELKGFF